MTKTGFSLAVALSVGAWVPAQAALVGTAVPSSSVAFDSQLTSPSLIYDANFYSATEGRLVLLASGSSLKGPGVPGSNGIAGSAPSQTYLGSGDALKDLVLSIRINNVTGALVSGSVFIPRDNNSASTNTSTGDSWTYSGSITRFGSTGTAGATVALNSNTFDAYYTVDSYDFSDVAANPALVGAPTTCTSTPSVSCGGAVESYLRFGTGAIALNGDSVAFGSDFVRGAGVSTANTSLGAYINGINAAAFNTSAVSTDVTLTPIPVPAAFGLMAFGLSALAPALRRRRKQAT